MNLQDDRVEIAATYYKDVPCWAARVWNYTSWYWADENGGLVKEANKGVYDTKEAAEEAICLYLLKKAGE